MTNSTGENRRNATGARMSRRRLLQASALAVPGMMALSACARPTTAGAGAASSAAPSLQLASPTNPVKWPIAAGNEPIAAGLEPERNATLRLYN